MKTRDKISLDSGSPPPLPLDQVANATAGAPRRDDARGGQRLRMVGPDLVPHGGPVTQTGPLVWTQSIGKARQQHDPTYAMRCIKNTYILPGLSAGDMPTSDSVN